MSFSPAILKIDTRWQQRQPPWNTKSRNRGHTVQIISEVHVPALFCPFCLPHIGLQPEPFHVSAPETLLHVCHASGVQSRFPSQPWTHGQANVLGWISWSSSKPPLPGQWSLQLRKSPESDEQWLPLQCAQKVTVWGEASGLRPTVQASTASPIWQQTNHDLLSSQEFLPSLRVFPNAPRQLEDVEEFAAVIHLTLFTFTEHRDRNLTANIQKQDVRDAACRTDGCGERCRVGSQMLELVVGLNFNSK